MLKEYFSTLQDRLLLPKKDEKESKKSTKKGSSKSIDTKQLVTLLQDMVPSDLVISDKKPIDSSGYVPKTVDYIAYYKKWSIIEDMMNGHIPSELVYATYHIVDVLNENRLVEVLNNVALTKKLNKFAETEQEILIPAFILAITSEIELSHIKSVIVDYYMGRHIDNKLEFDIMMIVDRGLVIKDWSEKRKYVALETEDDTLLWFFILMNEYLDVEKKHSLDLRSYVKEHRRYYKEY